jgi:23S rRNA (uracil1939-C5)-methyltransferase
VQLTIESLNNRGIGVSAKTLVPYTLPGELVTVKPIQQAKYFTKAELITIDTPSPERVTPTCKHYYQCGGCNLQHLSDKLYHDFKQQLLIEALGDAGFAMSNPPVVIIGPYSRRRTQLKVQGQQLGYYKASSHELVTIEECPILEPALSALFPSLKFLIKQVKQIKEITLTSCDNGVDMLIIADKEPSLSEQELLVKFAYQQELARISWQVAKHLLPIIAIRSPQIKFGNILVNIPEDCFLQATKLSQQLMTKMITGHCGGKKSIIDLYAGCGTYSLALANVAKVHAVEGSKQMIEAIQQTKSNVSTELRDLYHSPVLAQNLNHYDVALINPPRNGAEPQIQQIAKSKIKQVIIVSCNPQSFSRDARILKQAGYTLKDVTAFDQFHWSPHLEVVGVFER